jgi:hypothetical protein
VNLSSLEKCVNRLILILYVKHKQDFWEQKQQQMKRSPESKRLAKMILTWERMCQAEKEKKLESSLWSGLFTL